MSDDHDLLVRMDEKLTIALSRLDDHEQRIRTVERRAYALAALAAAIGVVTGIPISAFLPL